MLIKDESIDKTSDVIVYMDSIKHVAKAGQVVKVPVGRSITLTPYMYYSFWAIEGAVDLVVGKVSSVNDDNVDSTINIPYAEKYILLKDGQGLPTHFHFSKTEDIINRAGGVLALMLYNAIYMDSIKHVVKAGQVVKVPVGSSITLTPYMYHSFWAIEGAGDLVVGEVSSVNDDNVDNRFNPTMPRFGKTEENEEKNAPLCNEHRALS